MDEDEVRQLEHFTGKSRLQLAMEASPKETAARGLSLGLEEAVVRWLTLPNAFLARTDTKEG